MYRRTLLNNLIAAGALTAVPGGVAWAADAVPVSVDSLPKLKGDLTLYLGRGEGGLYENVIDAIRKRNPDLNLMIRRGPTAALANTLVAEGKAGGVRADVFWAVDAGAVGLVNDAGLARPLPADLVGQLKPGFRYPNWAPVTGRIRTVPYNTSALSAADISDSILGLADKPLKFGWAPAYGAFQSFVTALRLINGDKVALDWLKAMKSKSREYAGELGVVMGVERGEVDAGFANHYYTLRLKSGKPDARVDLAFTNNDAGCLLNASGVLALKPGDTAINFIRYLLTAEVQGYLAREAFEVPMVAGVPMPEGLPSLASIHPPRLDLTQLADIRPTLDLMREARLL